MTFSMRTVIRPHLLLDVVTGELLADRAVVVDGKPRSNTGATGALVTVNGQPGQAARRARRQSRGRVRGTPKRARSPRSPKRVSMLTWLPRSVSTTKLLARHIGAQGSGRYKTRAG